MSKLLKENKRSFREVVVWLIVTLVVVLFRVVYYALAHGLSSSYLDYAWLAPFALMAVDALLFLLHLDVGDYGRIFINTGFASLILYLLISGIDQMSSSANAGTVGFLIAFFVLVGFGALISLFHLYQIRRPAKTLS